MTALLSSSSMLPSSSSEPFGSTPRRSPLRGVRRRLLLWIGLLLATGAHAQDRKYPDGANVFLIGNSFFVPNGREFDSIAQSNGDAILPAHVFRNVQRGGSNGNPGALWRDTFNEVDAVLRTGTVDVLGMTAGAVDAEVIDYQRWIDLALTYNLNTDFWISAPWVRLTDFEGTEDNPLGPDRHTELTEFVGETFFSTVVEPLRAQYAVSNPNIRIMYSTHGVNTADLYTRYSADPAMFDGIVGLFGTRGTSDMFLFRDVAPGHGGDMVELTNGLFYYSFLYLEDEDDIATVVLPTSSNIYNQELMRDVVRSSFTYNQRYANGQFPPTAPTAAGPTPAPTPHPDNAPTQRPNGRPNNRPIRFCLPGSSLVLMSPSHHDNTTKRLDELKTGDQVLSIPEPFSAKATSEDVVYLPHLFNQVETEFLEFTCQSMVKAPNRHLLKVEHSQRGNLETTRHTLRVTEWHYVFVLEDHDKTSTAILANEVQVGDKLWKTRQLPDDVETFVVDPCIVSSIDAVWDSSGYYTAFTTSGKLLVNDGFVVSSYAGGGEGYYLLYNVGHTLSHTATGFLRWLYQWGWADSPMVRRFVDTVAVLSEPS